MCDTRAGAEWLTDGKERERDRQAEEKRDEAHIATQRGDADRKIRGETPTPVPGNDTRLTRGGG